MGRCLHCALVHKCIISGYFKILISYLHSLKYLFILKHQSAEVGNISVYEV
jgi:hypothetical protein